jgi:aryl-alcohol dehydrogenase-like predicted oxidoreductase
MTTSETDCLPHLAAGAGSVPRIGIGCMGMSEFYGARDDEQSLRVLRMAFEAGARHFDTANIYGRGANERLLARFLADLGNERAQVLVASKVGIRRTGDATIAVDSSPTHVQEACDESLQRLGIERLDLLYLHRRNPDVPIEDTVGAMAELVQRGKVRLLGLSEVASATLERACQIAPIAALQSEYSLWTRAVEQDSLEVCRRLNVAFVASSPLGRGFLTGELQPSSVAAGDDLRSRLPRFERENFERNLPPLATLRSVAKELDAQPAQVAIAWLLTAAPFIHVIPGSSTPRNVAINLAAAHLMLQPDQRERLNHAFAPENVFGSRYPQALMDSVNT